jgi:rRNA maturation endonuclease Nob1
MIRSKKELLTWYIEGLPIDFEYKLQLLTAMDELIEEVKWYDKVCLFCYPPVIMDRVSTCPKCGRQIIDECRELTTPKE